MDAPARCLARGPRWGGVRGRFVLVRSPPRLPWPHCPRCAPWPRLCSWSRSTELGLAQLIVFSRLGSGRAGGVELLSRSRVGRCSCFVSARVMSPNILSRKETRNGSYLGRRQEWADGRPFAAFGGAAFLAPPPRCPWPDHLCERPEELSEINAQRGQDGRQCFHRNAALARYGDQVLDHALRSEDKCLVGLLE